MKKISFLGLHFLLLLGLFLPQAEARDPRSEEIPEIQDIAFFLHNNTFQIYSVVANEGGVFSDYRETVRALDQLNRKAAAFHERALKSAGAPWRATSAYRELNQAFIDARTAFIVRPIYFLDPRAFEETAFLMGALLSFYQGPVYAAYGGYGYPAYVYPRNYYGWIPSYYNFATVRFANPRVYPWGARVVFTAGRR